MLINSIAVIIGCLVVSNIREHEKVGEGAQLECSPGPAYLSDIDAIPHSLSNDLLWRCFHKGFSFDTDSSWTIISSISFEENTALLLNLPYFCTHLVEHVLVLTNMLTT